MASKPDAPVSASPLIVQDLININTQELEALLDDEQEFYETVEEFEHNVGVNNSMVDWYNVNFESSFSNTGEFANRAAVVPQQMNCEDCKVNSTTFDKQRELLAKQDKQLQDGLRCQKERNEEIKKLKSMNKSLESRLEETTSMLETVLEETTNEITTLKSELKTKADLLEAIQSKTLSKTSTNTVNKKNEVEVEIEKCKVCGYSSKSSVVMNKHMESRHNGVKVFKCLMCSEVLNSRDKYRQHKAKHQKELDVITFKHVCLECNISFGSSDEELQHMLDEHRPKHFNRKKSKPKQDEELEECQNGPSCKWLKQNRCMFEHTEQPVEQPWKVVKSRRQKQQPRQLPRQHQQKEHPRQQQNKQIKKQSLDACRNGPSCKFHKDNRCMFSHETKRQQIKSSDRKQYGQSSQLKPCKFGSRCDRVSECGFLHLAKDFLPAKGGKKN